DALRPMEIVLRYDAGTRFAQQGRDSQTARYEVNLSQSVMTVKEPMLGQLICGMYADLVMIGEDLSGLKTGLQHRCERGAARPRNVQKHQLLRSRVGAPLVGITAQVRESVQEFVGAEQMTSQLWNRLEAIQMILDRMITLRHSAQDAAE